jgi:glutamine amidotransferase
MDEERRFYFVHSYHLRCAEPEDVVATTHYGYDFPAVVKKRNIMGTQFHPEKSHRYGLQLLKNFLAMS